MTAKLKLLFICTANVSRSRTAEDLFKDSPFYDALSAGIKEHPKGGQVVTQKLIDWADRIFVMDEKRDGHLSHLRNNFNVFEKDIYVLDIRDVYIRGSEFLVPVLIEKLASCGITNLAPLQDILLLNKLVREALGENADKPFRPFAVYRKALDDVLVLVKDCSYTQVRVNKSLAMLQANYPSEGKIEYIGFEIWGIRHFCVMHKRDYHGRTNIRELLEDIWTVYPCPDLHYYREAICDMLTQVDAVELPVFKL